jgi:hypothetical protein
MFINDKHLSLWLKTTIGRQNNFYELSMLNPEKYHDLIRNINSEPFRYKLMSAK